MIQHTEILLPQNIYIDSLFKYYENDAFVFNKRITQINPTIIHLDYSYRSKEKEVSPEGYAKVCQERNEIMGSLRLSWFYQNPNRLDVSTLFDNINLSDLLNMSEEERLAAIKKWSSKVESANDSSVNNDNSEPILEHKDGKKLDTQPTYSGGMAKLYQKINKLIKYPTMAKKNGVSGRVFVSLTIGRSGKIVSAKAVKGTGAGCDEEALRVIIKTGDWTPARVDNETVEETIILPVTFRL